MRISWEDRRGSGVIDGHPINTKPNLGFKYAWFNVTDTTAEFVESHEYGYWNKEMSDAQLKSVMDFYNSWVPPEEPVGGAGPEPTPEERLAMEREQMIVTMRQARLALLKQGLLTQVEAAIDSLAEPQKTEVKIEWEYAAVVERTSNLISFLMPALGLTETEIDDLFTLAETL